MRACFVVLALTSTVAARPRPHLTPEAAALLDKGGLFLVPDDNLAVPLAGGKPVGFLDPPPAKLELAAPSSPQPLLLVDEELFRVRGVGLARVGSRTGAMPAVTPDFSLVAGVDEKKALKLTRDGASKIVPYHREGRWELEHPYLTPDGATVLVTLRDYTQPLDAYEFLVVDVASGALSEVKLSKSFVPGPLRQPLSPTQVLLQMFSQNTDEQGFQRLAETDLVVFDLAQKKLAPAPPGQRPGLPSASGRYSLLPGAMSFSDDKRCGGDETLLFEAGKPKPARFVFGPGTVVSLLDFLPDEKAAIANVLTLKTCKNRGVLIPLAGESKPAQWKPFALPTREGHLTGRVLTKSP